MAAPPAEIEEWAGTHSWQFRRVLQQKPDSRSPSLLKGRLDDPFLAEFVAPQIGNDPAIAEHIHVIAILEFFHLGGVPEERATSGGLRVDQVINLELGTDIDAAHRIIH